MSDKPTPEEIEKKTHGCWDYVGIGCCSSCHSDWQDGYGEPFEEEYEDFIWARCCSANFPPELLQPLAESCTDKPKKEEGS